MSRRNAGAPGAVYRDPMLFGVLAFGLLVVTWLLVDPGHPTWRTQLGWVAQMAFDVSFTGVVFRIARRPALPPAVRRFYRVMTFAAACFAFGDVSQVVVTVVDPGPAAVNGGPVQMAAFIVGALAAVVVLMFYPTAIGRGRERLRFWLDAATVLVGGAALAWALAAGPDVDGATGLIAAGLVLLATFAATKLLYSPTAPLSRTAALPCVAAAALQGVGIFLTGVLQTGQHLGVALSLQVLATLSILCGFRMQELEVQHGRPWPVRDVRRSRNALPYIATIAAVLTLGVVLPASAGPKAWGVLLAVLVISLLVTVRQVDAFSQLGENERWYRSLLQHSTDITLVLNADGRIRFASPAVERVLGIPFSQVVGKPLDELVHPDDRDAARAAFAELSSRPGGTTTVSARYRHADGGWRWLDGASTNLLETPGVNGVVCNARDVTEARRFRDQLQHEATHDPLTGLPNRALFTERLNAAAAGQCALLLVDLDDFKPVNDVYGHPAGDDVLVEVAARLRSSSRAGDTPARLGGDEFAVVLPRATRADAEVVVERFRDLLREPIDAAGHRLTIGSSVGIGVGRGLGSEALLSVADQAMYEVKKSARGTRVSR
ncbi:diguanylate cyclase domain-containing protein [Cryptosporangium sp. NPDC051539]|uniref:diguanylate cyclase domain-containing protein n=1 Tax=Cryptosporangium sp. NPDC051539 TaxID=3363962 RepID=UPI0037A8FCFF